MDNWIHVTGLRVTWVLKEREKREGRGREREKERKPCLSPLENSRKLGSFP